MRSLDDTEEGLSRESRETAWPVLKPGNAEVVPTDANIG
jgi:hypothetical protein